jgi:hypothetical protein
MLQPSVAATGSALSALNIRRWKTSGDVKDAMAENAGSIQNDLNGTLPDLIRQADAAPGSVPETFAVYRNLDALYDVLLRVTENASLEAPREETAGLQSALDSLKQARSHLGEMIVSQSKDQQAQITQLKATIARAVAAAERPVTAKTTVVDDGPAKTTTVHRRKRPAAKTPAKPESSTSTTPPAGQPPKPQ